MRFIGRILRLIHIQYVLLKYGLDEMLPWNNPIRIIVLFSPAKWGSRQLSRGRRLRLVCEELGPIFVKFGQLLSTRIDLLPDDIAAELVKLQDKVSPFCGELARNIVEESLGQPINQLFAHFELEPLASASISQVHSAQLLDGKEVVVKILRPNIDKKIKCDIELLITLAKLGEKYWRALRRFRPYEVVKELEKSIFDELDLVREAANASQLRRNFADSKLLYVPEVYWQYSKKNILVLERIYGIPISNIKELNKHNTNLKLLAERGVEIFFTQVFRDCFFHADMHPGNVWVSTVTPTDPKYMALDFGIIGTLGPEDQRYLAENFLAFFKRDYRRVAELHIESGWVPQHTRLDEFESAIRSVCEPIFERPLKDISFGKTLLRLFQTARRFDMQIQPQLILLQKTLISVEGLGRQLYPDLDLWNTAKPFLEEWMRKRVSIKTAMQKLVKHGPYFIERLPEIPDIMFKLTNQLTKRQANQMVSNKLDKRYFSKSSFILGSLSSITCIAIIFFAYPKLPWFIVNHSKLIFVSSLSLAIATFIANYLAKHRTVGS